MFFLRQRADEKFKAPPIYRTSLNNKSLADKKTLFSFDYFLLSAFLQLVHSAENLNCRRTIV